MNRTMKYLPIVTSLDPIRDRGYTSMVVGLYEFYFTSVPCKITMASERRVTHDLLFFVLSFFLVFCLFFYLFVFLLLVFQSVYSPMYTKNRTFGIWLSNLRFIKKFFVKNRNVFFFNYNTLVTAHDTTAIYLWNLWTTTVDWKMSL